MAIGASDIIPLVPSEMTDICQRVDVYNQINLSHNYINLVEKYCDYKTRIIANDRKQIEGKITKLIGD